MCMNIIYMNCICIHCILFLLGTFASELLDQSLQPEGKLASTFDWRVQKT
jgi:hypothetical protein